VVVEVGEPLPVRCPPDALRAAVEDVLRVAWVRAAGKRNVRVQCLRFGHEGVIRVPYPYRWVQPQTLDVVGDEALLGAYWYADESRNGRTFARIHLGA